MSARSSARCTGLLVAVGVALSAAAATAQPVAPDAAPAPTASPAAAAHPGFPERTGGRVGIGLYAGLGSLVNAGSHGMVGVALRVGGAFTDRFHLLGELSLLATMGPGTYFQGALDLEGQVYALPRLYVRAGFGAKYDIASYGGGWPRQSNSPWLHLVGGIGWDLHRRAERAVAVELLVTRSLTDDQDFRWSPNEADPRYGTTVGLGLCFDWY